METRDFKKCLLTIMLLVCCTSLVKAEVLKCTAYELAYKTYNEYTRRWTAWSDWEDVNILVVINSDKERINIYSAEEQEFDIIDTSDYTDSDGADNLEMDCIDADGVRCTVRLRIQKNGVIQLYCEYSNIRYVYNLEAR